MPGPFHLGYPVPRGLYDEMVDGRGVLREHWEEFVEALATLSDGEMAARWERGQRMIRENGVTYNVYGDPQGLDRPWSLDPIPFMISAKEWRDIESALVQRANLLNHVLGDLYGPRNLLKNGLLPPAVAFSHPSYLRPCHDIPPVGGVYLHVYAADLARSPDGRWWVVADRAESPSGAGYAVENRLIVSRTLPEFFRTTEVQRLSPFFEKLQDTLFSLSPRRSDTPRIVLLTPGPYNETYFEHAYLARTLGYTLVEAADLTVRDARVYLKTLDGLQAVDVILRRTDSSFCDPLELRSDSSLGVPGLVEAVRSGNVVVANALGSGLIESSALMAFLPSLSRHFLGEDLKMPSVATWWCGQKRERDYVTQNLSNLILDHAYPKGGPGPLFGDCLSDMERQTLIGKIAAKPYDYLAQEYVPLSTTPVWSNGRLSPRGMNLRVYLAAHDGSYVAMPGGLTRVTPAGERLVVTMQQGGGSKDTWVLRDQLADPPISIRTSIQPVKLTRGARDLPSRVADNMYWLGRYLERCDGTTRRLRTALSLADEPANATDLQGLLACLRLFARPGSAEGEAESVRGFTPEARLRNVVRAELDCNSPMGLKASIDQLQRAAFVVRDRLSVDTWRGIKELQEEFDDLSQCTHRDFSELESRLSQAVLSLSALSGLAMENMTRGLGWRFYDIGRRIERGFAVIEVLSSFLLSETGDSPIETLLDVTDSIMTYRSRYFSSPQLAPSLDLLFADESNPRSLAFQLAALSEHVDVLASIGKQAPFYTEEQRVCVFISGAVKVTDVTVLAKRDGDGGRRILAQTLEMMHSKLWELSENLTRSYFTHAATRRPRRKVTPVEEAGRLP